MLATLLFALTAQPAAFDPSRWTIQDPKAVTQSYLGQPSLFIDSGIALLRDPSFADGTIDVDVALHGHASFAGLVFRAASDENYELVYVRPHKSRQPDALQYTPVFDGSEGWQLYSGAGFTAAAELPLNRWVHLRLVVSGYSARLFIDGASTPALVVQDLKRPWARGRVGLWGRFGGANFANFTVTPAASDAPPLPAATAISDQLLMDWDLSPAFDSARMRDDVLPELNASTWTAVRAEPNGIVNIARYRKSALRPSSPATSRDVAFARAVITSVQPRQAKLVFAYSDAVHIFVNGRLLFAGESAFRSRDPAFLGIASLGPDVLYIDLKPGRNEVVFALTETFGGWGFGARLEPMEPNLGLGEGK